MTYVIKKSVAWGRKQSIYRACASMDARGALHLQNFRIYSLGTAEFEFLCTIVHTVFPRIVSAESILF